MRNLISEPENVQIAGTSDAEYRVEMTGYANWGSPSLWPEKPAPADGREGPEEDEERGAKPDFERLPPVDFLKLVSRKKKKQVPD